jgi:hypothetical protein
LPCTTAASRKTLIALDRGINHSRQTEFVEFTKNAARIKGFRVLNYNAAHHQVATDTDHTAHAE